MSGQRDLAIPGALRNLRSSSHQEKSDLFKSQRIFHLSFGVGYSVRLLLSGELRFHAALIRPSNESTLSSRRHEVLRCALTRGF